jgi:hypothetical protein
MEEYDACFELLELTSESSLEDIRKRYRYLKKLYSGDSIEIRALNDDFSQDIKEDYLTRLDKAFEKLSELSEKNNPLAKRHGADMDTEMRLRVSQIESFTGAALKSIRERMNVDLTDIFTITRIQPHFLDAIECEEFGSFQAEVYLRSYLIEYTRFFSLDTQRVLSDYLPRYRDWIAQQKQT